MLFFIFITGVGTLFLAQMIVQNTHVNATTPTDEDWSLP